jgi:hypothetical protein
MQVMLRVIRRPLVALALLLAATHLPAQGGDEAASLAEARTELVERTREYRSSLERLLALQEAAAVRAEAAAAKRRGLFEQGILSRRELEASVEEEASARALSADTRRRLAEADAVLAETLAAIELARAPAARVVTTPHAIGSMAGSPLTASAVAGLDRFFVARFARALPVSARGQTPVHDRLGLDHRHAVDVAVHPDSDEGRALIEYLVLHGIPFLAFRGFVPGVSTGAHVHVGRASARLLPGGGVVH